jgi:hypothetical protein
MNERRFRWEIILVPLTILAAAWFINGIALSFTWEDTMHFLAVRDKARYTRLAVLGITLIAICAAWRVLREGKGN